MAGISGTSLGGNTKRPGQSHAKPQRRKTQALGGCEAKAFNRDKGDAGEVNRPKLGG